MGLCQSEEEKNQIKASRAIDKKMKEGALADEKVIKLLLLGAGESGKSTLLKQMRYGFMKFNFTTTLFFGHLFRSHFNLGAMRMRGSHVLTKSGNKIQGNTSGHFSEGQFCKL